MVLVEHLNLLLGCVASGLQLQLWAQQICENCSFVVYPMSQNHRIIQLFMLEKALRIKFNHPPNATSPLLNHVAKNHAHTSLKHLQGWGHHHFPGQPVPVPDQPLHEEILPYVQFKPPLEQKVQ